MERVALTTEIANRYQIYSSLLMSKNNLIDK